LELCRRGRLAKQIEDRGTTRDHQYCVSGRWLLEAGEREKYPSPPSALQQRHAVSATVPAQSMSVLLPAPCSRLQFHKHVIFDLEHMRRDLVAVAVEHGIERLPVVAREVLLRGPVVGLQRREIGPPLEVVAQLVGQR